MAEWCAYGNINFSALSIRCEFLIHYVIERKNPSNCWNCAMVSIDAYVGTWMNNFFWAFVLTKVQHNIHRHHRTFSLILRFNRFVWHQYFTYSKYTDKIMVLWKPHKTWAVEEKTCKNWTLKIDKWIKSDRIHSNWEYLVEFAKLINLEPYSLYFFVVSLKKIQINKFLQFPLKKDK